MGNRDAAMRRVWSTMPDGAQEQLERALSSTDLQTLQLGVARERAARVTPGEVMRRWQTDRFVQPASVDPRVLSRLEAEIWSQVPSEFVGVELSPVAPLGVCSAVGNVSQDRVLSTVRASEVVSDSTNVLAVEAALRRRSSAGAKPVHLACCHRQLRAQDFGAGRSSHFRLFALVSSGPRLGSGRQESALLMAHIRCWVSVLTAVLPRTRARIELAAWDPVLRERLHDTVLPAFMDHPFISVVEDSSRVRARGYYSLGALLIVAETADGPVELGDGGFTDWTAKLTQNEKELCFTSCLATERVATSQTLSVDLPIV